MSKKILQLALGSIFFLLLTSLLSPALANGLSPEEERDEIYMLTAYSVVFKDWQEAGPNKRGHNIGSILVDKEGTIVRWARNCNTILNNGTQHGEVRLIIGYLNSSPKRMLDGYTIYTTLEPCAQCSGMMILTHVSRTVYGQTDPGFGKAIERLALDSRQWNGNGYTPYPLTNKLTSNQSPCDYRVQLDNAYQEANTKYHETKPNADLPITRFLLSNPAKLIYQAAATALQRYKVVHQDNQVVLEQAKKFLTTIKKKVPTITISANPEETESPSSPIEKKQKEERKETKVNQ